jgi:hypothetical protein
MYNLSIFFRSYKPNSAVTILLSLESRKLNAISLHFFRFPEGHCFIWWFHGFADLRFWWKNSIKLTNDCNLIALSKPDLVPLLHRKSHTVSPGSNSISVVGRRCLTTWHNARSLNYGFHVICIYTSIFYFTIHIQSSSQRPVHNKEVIGALTENLTKRINK